MLNPLATLLGKVLFKPLKYFIDSTFRDKAKPVPGSVVYCDLLLAVEHSGIHVRDGWISNIVVDGFAERTVLLDQAGDFTSGSKLGRKIYVSCNSQGPVGHDAVAQHAAERVGERGFYGLMIKNCHQFSTECVHKRPEVDQNLSWTDRFEYSLPEETWEPTIQELKRCAKDRLGATKWRLWDWQSDDGSHSTAEEEPDWDAINQQAKRLPLTANSIHHLRQQLVEARNYEAEIDDEHLPEPIRQRLRVYRQTVSDISEVYEQARDFLAACPGAGFCYDDLKSAPEDFSALARQIAQNAQIRELVRKMGRQHVSEELKRQTRIPESCRSEVHGTHRSNDLMRLLPSELLNLEDETLETLFYARLLEHGLLTYQLSGQTMVAGETTETRSRRTGPVVACLDTSGSMQGEPLLKAKALLLAVAGILKQEDRSLHVILFGASGQLRSFAMDANNDAVGLLAFLRQGFGGGTDFETPLKQALQLVEMHPGYIKADVLMVSDGDCSLSTSFTQELHAAKARLNCRVYSVLCAGRRGQDTFSDEIVVL